MGRPRRGIAVLVCSVLAAASCRGMSHHEIGGDGGPTRSKGSRPPRRDLVQTRSDMVLHPDAAVVAGRNVIWCATTQLAWDAMGVEIDKLSGKGPDLRLGPPTPPDVAASLNRHEFPRADLDAASYVVESGFVHDGVVDRFLQRVAAMGQTFPLDIGEVEPMQVLALAYLFKDLPFAQPFLVHDLRMSFDGGPSRVVTFGLDRDGSGAEEGRMLSETLLHEAGRTGGWDDSRQLALELLPEADGDRIVLGMIPPPKTLAEGWRQVAALRAEAGHEVPMGTQLEIPKIDFSVVRRFREIEGSLVLDAPPMIPPTRIKDFRQLIEFTLSEKGARLVAAVVMATTNTASGPPPHPPPIIFDHPFLLAMIRKGATHPYYLAWFGNDALFVRDDS